jgi:hypothetical protein
MNEIAIVGSLSSFDSPHTLTESRGLHGQYETMLGNTVS